MRSRRVEERRAEILAVWEARKDISLEKLRLALIGLDLHVSVAGLYRFFGRAGLRMDGRLLSAADLHHPAKHKIAATPGEKTAAILRERDRQPAPQSIATESPSPNVVDVTRLPGLA